MQRIGLNMYSLRELCGDEKSLRDAFARVSDAGYRYVQISGLNQVDPKAIGDAMRDRGLQACATHLSWDQFTGDVNSVINLHGLYGTTHSAIGGLPQEYRSLDGARRFVREAAKVLPALESAGLDFSYHNHSHEFCRLERRTWLDHVHELGKEVGIKYELDLYWIVAGGADPAQYIERFASDMSIIHVKDMIATPDREQRFAPVGNGNLNWPRIFAEIRRIPIEFVIVEQDAHYEYDAIENVARSFDFLAANGFSAQ